MSTPPSVASAPSALFILAPGFEELEAVAPLDILRRGGVAVTVAALGEPLAVRGRNDIVLQADCPLAEAMSRTFDALVLPGGPGVARLRADPRVGQIARSQADAGRLVAAICAAPTILLDAGLLVGRRYACHFSVHAELPHGENQAVVEDGHLITSQGAGTAVAFGLAILARLVSPEKAQAVAESICLPPA
jgi:protein deglycase